jgi:hypothetical protein
MKAIFGSIILSVLFLISCSDEKGRYVDLRTGETISVEKDPKTGVWINSDTKEPVYIYVDTRKHDTIYGRTGGSINGRVVKSSDNVWWYDADLNRGGDYKVKSGDDYKMKVEADGDVKIKDGDKKVKIDGETGEKKVENDD